MKSTEFTWPTDVAGARRVQELQKERIRIAPLMETPRFVAGADSAFSDDSVFAAVCVYRYPDLKLENRSTAVMPVEFPYVPGYLLFREGPAIVSAIRKLPVMPDVLLIDGHGIAHPRGIGSASHLGVLLGIPTIGCAKTRLVGEFKEPAAERGNWSALEYRGTTVGAVLRTRDRVKPVFVSPGHKIDLIDSIAIVLGCAGNYRIPEPLRCADMLSRKLKAEAQNRAI